MKTRLGFVSNSSSSSFILSTRQMTAYQLAQILKKNSETDYEGWTVEYSEDGEHVSFWTSMDNCDLPGYAESLGVKITSRDHS